MAHDLTPNPDSLYKLKGPFGNGRRRLAVSSCLERYLNCLNAGQSRLIATEEAIGLAFHGATRPTVGCSWLTHQICPHDSGSSPDFLRPGDWDVVVQKPLGKRKGREQPGLQPRVR